MPPPKISLDDITIPVTAAEVHALSADQLHRVLLRRVHYRHALLTGRGAPWQRIAAECQRLELAAQQRYTEMAEQTAREWRDRQVAEAAA